MSQQDWNVEFTLIISLHRDEDRDKDHLKSSSSEESVRKRRPSGTISVKSQLSVFTSQTSQPNEADATNHQKSHHHQQQLQQQQSLNDKIENTSAPTSNNIPIPNKQLIESDFHYEVVDNVKNKYNYHDEPHSFENSMEFLEDYNHFQFEVLETTV